jgi:hypothetical protein
MNPGRGSHHGPLLAPSRSLLLVGSTANLKPFDQRRQLLLLVGIPHGLRVRQASTPPRPFFVSRCFSALSHSRQRRDHVIVGQLIASRRAGLRPTVIIHGSDQAKILVEDRPAIPQTHDGLSSVASSLLAASPALLHRTLDVGAGVGNRAANESSHRFLMLTMLDGSMPRSEHLLEERDADPFDTTYLGRNAAVVQLALLSSCRPRRAIRTEITFAILRQTLNCLADELRSDPWFQAFVLSGSLPYALPKRPSTLAACSDVEQIDQRRCSHASRSGHPVPQKIG